MFFKKKKKKKEEQKALVEKGKKRNPLQGECGNQYLSVLETLGVGMAGMWPSLSLFLPDASRWSVPPAACLRLCLGPPAFYVTLSKSLPFPGLSFVTCKMGEGQVSD